MSLRKTKRLLKHLATATKLDLIYALNKVNQFTEDPKVYHWKILYIKNRWDFINKLTNIIQEIKAHTHRSVTRYKFMYTLC